jgi:hypothetical protein
MITLDVEGTKGDTRGKQEKKASPAMRLAFANAGSERYIGRIRSAELSFPAAGILKR